MNKLFPLHPFTDGSALGSYQWMHNNNPLTSWTNSLHALQLQLALSQFEHPQGALFK